jgi:hypothetical protein
VVGDDIDKHRLRRVAADARTNHSTHLFPRHHHPVVGVAAAEAADVTAGEAAGRRHPDRLNGLF